MKVAARALEERQMKAQNRNLDRVVRHLFAGALLLLVAATPVESQSPNGSWLAFTGCWTPVDQASAEGPNLCVIPGEDRVSAEFVSVRGTEIVSREVATADGRPVNATQEGCEGTTTWRFSDDGHRVYHRSEHVCDGTVNRKGTGMMVMVSPTAWMDISSVEVEGQVTPWVQRYRMATVEVAEAAGYADLGVDQEMAIRAARMYSTTAPTITAIVEASQMLHPETVQAWLVEGEADFNVDAEMLIRMADAGVTSDVIDVVVAMAHPEYFRLNDQDNAGSGIEQRERVREGSRYDWLGSRSPRYYSPFGLGYGYGYSPSFGYGYGGYGYGYSPYRLGYGGYGLGYGSYGIGYRPVVVSVSPRAESSARGRLVKGRGYVGGFGGSRATTVGRDGGSSSAGASSGGSSGSGRSTGRTARRRGGSS